jgi:hypothetical protein
VNRRVAEIAAVVLTGAVYLVVENVLRWPKLPFLVACTAGWTAYLVGRIARDRAVLVEWGLRRDTLLPASLVCGAFLLLAAAGIGGYRWLAGWRPLPASALLVFAVYPLWGFIQQFVIQALIARNLEALGASRWLIVPVAATLFGLAHVPDVPLALLCFGGGLVWTTLFLWRPSLLPLALTHAWTGALVYYWILERNPWLEMFPAPAP